MADNKSVRDAANATFIGAADELADGSFSPKVSLLAGDGTATPIAPPTAAQVGAVNEAMPGSDTASSGLNGRLQRLAQRITALASQLPATLSGGGFLNVSVQDATPARAASGVASSVTASASAVTILAANTSRRGAAVFNDGSTDLLLLAGTGTASATVFTVKMVPSSYYEIPFGYSGALSGIWTAAPTGAARVTEFS